LYINDSNSKEKKTQISVIVYGNNSDRWATLKQGIDQGAADLGAEVNFVMMTAEDDAEEQKMLLEREIENGTKGIVLAATNSKEMAEVVKEVSLAIPIIMVETNVENVYGLNYISADNYSMGLNIGRSVFLSGDKERKIAIFARNQQRNSVYERYQGFMDSLQYSGYTITPWEMGAEDKDTSLFLQEMLKESPVDVIVALDDMSLEAVADAVDSSERTIDVYGIGSTNKIIHFLDYGIIKSIVFQNEFNMGYLSIQDLINGIKRSGNVLDIEIEFRTVNRETMYLPKNQRLVFPIVQ
jgi:ribose transport system substrate-binding protein